MARIQNDMGIDTWVKQRGILDEDWYIWFLHSFYYMTVLMITVGFGDIAPVNELEIITCIITMIFACGVFAYAVNELGQVLEKLRQKKDQINKNMYAISDWMNKKSVDPNLQYLVREYLWYFQKEFSEDEELRKVTVLNQLNNNLKIQVLKDANKIVLSQCPVLGDNFSEEFLEEIIPFIQESFFMPEQTICNRNSEHFLYFIEKGKVEILQQSKNSKQCKPIGQLGVGQFFGEISFFSGQKCQMKARSLEFTNILKISRQQFETILQNHQNDLQRFHNIKDRIVYNKEYSFIVQNCLSCNSKQHSAVECQELHYYPNQKRVLKEYNKDTSHINREFTVRKGKRALHSLSYQQIISEMQFQFAQDYQILAITENSQSEEEEEEDYYDDSISSYESEDYDYNQKIRGSNQQLNINNNNNNATTGQLNKQEDKSLSLLINNSTTQGDGGKLTVSNKKVANTPTLNPIQEEIGITSIQLQESNQSIQNHLTLQSPSRQRPQRQRPSTQVIPENKKKSIYLKQKTGIQDEIDQEKIVDSPVVITERDISQKQKLQLPYLHVQSRNKIQQSGFSKMKSQKFMNYSNSNNQNSMMKSRQRKRNSHSKRKSVKSPSFIMNQTKYNQKEKLKQILSKKGKKQSGGNANQLMVSNLLVSTMPQTILNSTKLQSNFKGNSNIDGSDLGVSLIEASQMLQSHNQLKFNFNDIQQKQQQYQQQQQQQNQQLLFQNLQNQNNDTYGVNSQYFQNKKLQNMISQVIKDNQNNNINGQNIPLSNFQLQGLMQQLENKEKEMYDYFFDIMKEYGFYFPHNNIKVVIDRFSKYQKKNNKHLVSKQHKEILRSMRKNMSQQNRMKMGSFTHNNSTQKDSQSYQYQKSQQGGSQSQSQTQLQQMSKQSTFMTRRSLQDPNLIKGLKNNFSQSINN